MAKVAFEQVFNGGLATNFGAYDSTKINLGSLLNQYSLGGGPVDSFLGPMPVTVMRPMETGTNFGPNYVHAVKWSETDWWVFYVETGAAATKRVGLYKLNPRTAVASWQGFITITFPTATNHTAKALKAVRTTYTTGSAAASGTAITGSGGTTWSASRIAVGSRIGFGSTDPTAISTWYEISAIGGDTSITTTASAGTISAGPYVIEELRLVIPTTNATATNGGLHVVKGLRVENFTVGGTAIAAAVSTDNVRACYWLKDASTETNTAAGGLALDAAASFTSHDAYLTNGAASSLIIYRYNLRAALTVATGAAVLTVGADLTITGAQTVTGTLSAIDNVTLATAGHGPGSGTKCLYVATATRINRITTAAVTAGNTTFVADSMTEVPPGGTNTFQTLAGFQSPQYDSTIDRFVIANGAGDTPYVTQYRADGGQMTHKMLARDNQMIQSIIDSNATAHPMAGNGGGAVAYISCVSGMWFHCNQASTAANGVMAAWPGGAHWTYASTTGQRAILPEINLGAVPSKFYRVLKTFDSHVGGDEIGKVPEPFRLLYRTSGISDNSGSWTAVPGNGDLSGVSAASSIQFAIEFKMISDFMVPARVTSIALLYESADDLPSQYNWNFADFNTATGVFAWIQRVLFGGSLTTHTINIYRTDTNALVLTQASTGTTNGTFEYWNGSTWVAGLSTDTLGTRRRFSPTGALPSGVPLKAVLTVA